MHFLQDGVVESSYRLVLRRWNLSHCWSHKFCNLQLGCKLLIINVLYTKVLFLLYFTPGPDDFRNFRNMLNVVVSSSRSFLMEGSVLYGKSHMFLRNWFMVKNQLLRDAASQPRKSQSSIKPLWFWSMAVASRLYVRRFVVKFTAPLSQMI